MNKIELNYFLYEYRRIYTERARDCLENIEYLELEYDERINLMNVNYKAFQLKSLRDICLKYLNLSNQYVSLEPENGLEMLKVVLCEAMNDNCYLKSFLFSASLILSDLIEFDTEIYPIISLNAIQSERNETTIKLDINYNLLDFYFDGVSEVDQVKTIISVFEMIDKNKCLPLNRVKFDVDKSLLFKHRM